MAVADLLFVQESPQKQCRGVAAGESERFRDGPKLGHALDSVLILVRRERCAISHDLVGVSPQDVQVLDHLDDILSVEGIDLFTSGAQDIAQSMGLPGQPNHPQVKEFEAQVRDSVHAAGRKMAEDVMASARAANLFLDGARAFLNSQ